MPQRSEPDGACLELEEIEEVGVEEECAVTRAWALSQM